MRHIVIYVPGIRDNLYGLQGILIQLWRLRGVRPVLHAMPWYGPQAYELKMHRLLRRIDYYSAQGHTVSLVGASAGAAAVMQAYVARREQISGVVFICGKLQSPESVSRTTYHNNPAFGEAMQALPNALAQLKEADYAKLLSLYSPIDRVVPASDSEVTGVRHELLPSLSHGRAIIYAISRGAAQVINFLRRQTP